MSGVLQVFANGLLIGGVYGLVAVGLNLVFGVLKIVNFAYGEFLMMSMYMSYILVTTLDLDPYLAAPVVAVLMFFVGLVLQRVLINKVVGQPEEASILLTIGISAFLYGTAQAIWGPDYRSVRSPLEAHALTIAGIQIPTTRLIAFLLSLASSLAVYIFLHRTPLGKQIRAAAENLTIAQLLGIDTLRIYAITFGLGTALAALAGAILTPVMYVFPRVGQLFTLTGFVVVVFGGLGDLRGGLVAGLLLGVVESLVGTYVSFEAAKMVMFLIFVMLLLLRPQGMFGRLTA